MKNLLSHSGFVDEYDTNGKINMQGDQNYSSKLEQYQSRLYESLQQSNELQSNILAYQELVTTKNDELEQLRQKLVGMKLANSQKIVAGS